MLKAQYDDEHGAVKAQLSDTVMRLEEMKKVDNYIHTNSNTRTHEHTNTRTHGHTDNQTPNIQLSKTTNKTKSIKTKTKA